MEVSVASFVWAAVNMVLLLLLFFIFPVVLVVWLIVLHRRIVSVEAGLRELRRVQDQNANSVARDGATGAARDCANGNVQDCEQH